MTSVPSSSIGRLRWLVRTAYVLVGLALTAGCGGSPEEDESTHVQGESLLMIDDRVCGFFDTDLVVDAMGDDELKSWGDGLLPSDERRSKQSKCQVVSKDGGGAVLSASVSENPEPLPKSTDRRTPSLGPGCVKASQLSSWRSAVLCRDNYGVTVRASSTKRAITVSLDPAYGQDEKKAERSAVALLKNLDENVDRYDAEHGG